ncbi:glycolate utilization protein [Sphingomonas sp. DBB INV C78]|uniref:GlcG/HbpS family heme-binding protein n=1 Tax=Sphingomonas sp. DBB INV C78 TaxID=3349434 RepID=UPI0036D2DDA1
MPIFSHIAQAIIEQAEAKAREMGLSAIIAILDDGGHLKAFHRMDGAVLGSIDIAIRKARTAVLFQCNSEDVWDYLKPGAPAPHLELSNDGLAPYAGGMALKCPTGGLAGALGVSGGTIEQDAQIAKAGFAAFEATLR